MFHCDEFIKLNKFHICREVNAARGKVILYKSRGRVFLWNIICDLGRLVNGYRLCQGLLKVQVVLGYVHEFLALL